ncbi:Met-10+ like-protein-domain-containing protein [Blastocladiella britannica]|nr:Met-10+ like-protein-domain-containing protein [Blastocladiella britannica]
MTTSPSALLRTPPLNQAMRTLDRARFVRNVPLLSLRVPTGVAHKATKALHGCLLDWPRVKNIMPDPSDPKGKTSKLLLLSRDKACPADSTDEVVDPTLRKMVADLGVAFELVPYSLSLPYEYWTVEEIFKSVLPPDTEIISAFETVGDIAHMNLRDHLLPYKHLIAEVIIDKNTRIQTVVNKTSNIHTVYRTFPLEILASRNPKHTSDTLLTTLAENSCTFTLNFASVYWNSRLHTEHSRLVTDVFGEGELVADAMCGIGPFAIPAAKVKACAVVANDLNPESYRWLVENIKGNGLAGLSDADDAAKVSAGYVRPLNTCGRQFIRDSAATLASLYPTSIRPAYIAMAAQERARAAAKTAKKKDASAHVAAADRFDAAVARWDSLVVPVFAHYVMNLPASALGFLDGFHGMWSNVVTDENRAWLADHRPRVHVYCFTRAAFVGRADDESEDAAVARDVGARIAQVTGAQPEEITCHRVRLVAPRKEMVCASFRVPMVVLMGETVVGDVDCELNYDHDSGTGRADDADDEHEDEKTGRRTSASALDASEGPRPAKRTRVA